MYLKPKDTHVLNENLNTDLLFEKKSVTNSTSPPPKHCSLAVHVDSGT